jgi:glycosyltransferase involved in cell wall biosynthesis
MKKLTVGYSTLASRVKNLQLPKPSELFEVLVSVQLDASYEKKKVETIELESVGVTKSRNAVIDKVSTEYLVFADDDIEVIPNGLRQVVEYLDHHPDVSLVLARVNAGDKPRKKYPEELTALTKLNSAKAATPEMVIRVKDIKQAGVSFDEEFGAGAKNFLGDEYIFVSDCLSAGLKAVALPIPIATHDELSSGSEWKTPESIAARAKVFSRVFGGLALFPKIGFAYKNFNNFGSVRNVLKFLTTS